MIQHAMVNCFLIKSEERKEISSTKKEEEKATIRIATANVVCTTGGGREVADVMKKSSKFSAPKIPREMMKRK